MKEVLLLNGIKEELYFITTQPIEFMDDAEDNEDAGEKEERTGVKGNNSEYKEDKKKVDTKLSAETFDASEQVNWLKHLNKVGEDDLAGEEYELVESTIAEENESDNIEEDLNRAIQLSAMQPSQMDSKLFKVRYAYVHRSGKKSASSKKS